MPVFDEVKRLDLDICDKYGITVISPIIANVDDFDLKYKSLSEVDRSCFETAYEANCICVTNDKSLRNACENYGVEVFWGLELMVMLVERNIVSANRAIEIAYEIRTNSQFYIKEEIVERFSKIIRKIKT